MVHSTSFFYLPFTRDGRVSDNTTMLVRHLLNLNPHQRLKAGQVVDFLDSAIASNYLKSAAKERALLQLVPDTDSTTEKLLQPPASETTATESDFERILKQLQV